MKLSDLGPTIRDNAAKKLENIFFNQVDEKKNYLEMPTHWSMFVHGALKSVRHACLKDMKVD